MLFIGEDSGSQTLNTDIFASDLPSNASAHHGGFIKVLVSVATGAVLNATLDGTNYTALNGGTALTADVLYEFNFPVSSDDVLNFQVGTTAVLDVFKVFYFD